LWARPQSALSPVSASAPGEASGNSTGAALGLYDPKNRDLRGLFSAGS
jgi:hypothetical protein